MKEIPELAEKIRGAGGVKVCYGEDHRTLSPQQQAWIADALVAYEARFSTPSHVVTTTSPAGKYESPVVTNQVAPSATVTSEWVACSERMPAPHEEVLIYEGDGDDIEQAYLSEGRWKNRNGYLLGVTHWMPRPSAPIKATDGRANNG